MPTRSNQKARKKRNSPVFYGPANRPTILELPSKISVGKKKKSTKNKMNKIPSGNLSACAVDYALALSDPFDGPLACVPSTYPPIPSFKTRVWSKGNISIGSSGYGFVVIAPGQCAANDSVGILSSSTAYAQFGFPGTSLDTGVIQANTNSLFTTAQIGPVVGRAKFRQVSCGVRVWYIGSELNLQGEMYGVREPDNNSLLGLSAATLLNYPSSRRVVVTSLRAPLEIIWIPVQPVELTFQTSTTNGAYSLGIVVTGPAASAGIFAYEVFSILEYVGSNVPMRTSSHADPVGFSSVLNAVQDTGDTWYGRARDFAKETVKVAASGLSALSNSRLAAGVGQGIGSAMFGGRMSFPDTSGTLPRLPSMERGRVTVTEEPEEGDKGSDHLVLRPGHQGPFTTVEPSLVRRDVAPVTVVAEPILLPVQNTEVKETMTAILLRLLKELEDRRS